MKIEWDENRDVCIKCTQKEFKEAFDSFENWKKFMTDIDILCHFHYQDSMLLNPWFSDGGDK